MVVYFVVSLVSLISGWFLCKVVSGEQVKPLSYLLYVLPFFCGGFYTPVCTAVSVYLLGYLIWICRRQKSFSLHLTDALAVMVMLFLSYSISFLWAADRGMSVWGIVRYFPVLLFVLALTQLPREQVSEVWCLVPLSAGLMTGLSLVMQYVPGLSDHVTVAGRLAGFFQYPNTYAAFLLAALAISGTEAKRSKWSWSLDTLLVLGILESGSRTAFVILIPLILLLCWIRKSKRFTLELGCGFVLCLAVSLLIPALGGDTSSSRYLTIPGGGSTFWGRLLYFSDALTLIIRYPLGLGYNGYHAVQGAYQTGVYDVAFVHNELLQLLLDVGWVPALAVAVMFLVSFFRRGTSARSRLVMMVVLGHSMMDFDLQYLVMWLMLLPAVGFHSVKPVKLRKGGTGAAACGCIIAAVCLWLSLGDGLYLTGNIDLCLKVTPFHTRALEYRLTQIQEAQMLDEAADEVLALNPWCSLAYSAKAEAAYAMGDGPAIIENKELAIQCARYSLEEYLDYFDKLQALYHYFTAEGDYSSADTAQALLESIPQKLLDLEQITSPLAWKLTDQPELELPDKYRTALAELAG